jgi:succinate-acetate transporter protein
MEAAAISRPEPVAAVVPAPVVIADPGPLGLAAFALTTFMLSAANAGVLGQVGIGPKGLGTVPVVLSLALAYGGIAQLLAGMWEFRTGNTFGAVAFTSFGAFWLSFWALLQFFAKDITSATQLNHAVGLYLIAWGIFTTYMFVASLRTTAAVAVVFLLLAIRRSRSGCWASVTTGRTPTSSRPAVGSVSPPRPRPGTRRSRRSPIRHSNGWCCL